MTRSGRASGEACEAPRWNASRTFIGSIVHPPCRPVSSASLVPSIHFVVAAQACVTNVARLVPSIHFVVAAQAGVTASRA